MIRTTINIEQNPSRVTTYLLKCEQLNFTSCLRRYWNEL